MAWPITSVSWSTPAARGQVAGPAASVPGIGCETGLMRLPDLRSRAAPAVGAAPVGARGAHAVARGAVPAVPAAPIALPAPNLRKTA
jgi:hypothetical protein